MNLCVVLQLHSVTQNTTHHKLHFIRDQRVRLLITEAAVAEAEAADTAALLCFSLASSLQLAAVVSSWSAVASSLPTVLVGTKADTRDSVSYQEAAAVARQIGAVAYVETSAKQSYTSVTSAFETAALALTPAPDPDSSSLPGTFLMSGGRGSTRSRRGDTAVTADPPSCSPAAVSRLEHAAQLGSSSTLAAARRAFSSSSGSLHSKSSTLSSCRSTASASILSVSTGKTPILGRRSHGRRAAALEPEPEKMVTIKVERLTRDKQVEEVEIEIPVSVYNNMETSANTDTDFVRNSGRRKSRACKLKNLILR